MRPPMDQLKRALVRAGFESKDQQKQIERKPKKKVALSGEKAGHAIRTQCELCDAFTNDVEYYQHNDRRVATKWLCINCADEHSINDMSRETNQSPNARNGSFHRRFGRTKKF
jgi:hypothetical protein